MGALMLVLLVYAVWVAFCLSGRLPEIMGLPPLFSPRVRFRVFVYPTRLWGD